MPTTAGVCLFHQRFITAAQFTAMIMMIAPTIIAGFAEITTAPDDLEFQPA